MAYPPRRFHQQEDKMRVQVKRLPSGLYEITKPDRPNETSLVGGAASTIIALCSIIFLDEANGG